MLQENRNLWCYIDDEYASCCFGNKKEALEDWKRNRDDDKVNVVKIGHPKFYKPIVDADIVIENIQSQANCETCDYAEESREYLWHVKNADVAKLEKRLTAVFEEWAEQHGYDEKMHIVDKTEEYELLENGEFRKCQ